MVLAVGCSSSNTAAPPDGNGNSDGGARVSPPDLTGLGGPGTVIFVNKCTKPVWAAALANAGISYMPDNGGWEMDPGSVHVITLPAKWAGRFWGRTGCVFDANGQGHCDTGDCGHRLQCNGDSGSPPASLAEITLSGTAGSDIYDVSLVDGYNLPIAIAPQPGTFNKTNPNSSYNCGTPTCSSDLNLNCPQSLQQVVSGSVVGCMSAHIACSNNPSSAGLNCAANQDLYSCTSNGPNNVMGSCYTNGASNQCCGCPSWSPAGACKGHNPKWESPALPETLAQPFKTACPTAYSFPDDDPTSTFNCKATADPGAGYEVTFCP